jgi:CheY-like chemotaxis protein
MLKHHDSLPEHNTRALKLILLVVHDELIGAFLARTIKREMTHHVLFATHEHQALKVAQEVKPDLFLLDYTFAWGDGFALYDQLHATGGLEEVPALLCNISARFPRQHLKKLYLSDGGRSAELENFLHTIQEVLA